MKSKTKPSEGEKPQKGVGRIEKEKKRKQRTESRLAQRTGVSAKDRKWAIIAKQLLKHFRKEDKRYTTEPPQERWPRILKKKDLERIAMKKEYILASRLDGANKWQLFVHSILPNMTEMLVVQGTLALSVAVIDISALGFLNLGAQSPLPELGAILADGLDVTYLAPWNVALPGLTIFLLVLSINIVGDGLRSALRKRVSH